MKRTAVILGILSFALWAAARTAETGATDSAGSGQTAAATPGAPAPPQGKRPPQAKSEAELTAMEGGGSQYRRSHDRERADDFAAKFPDSELRVLLYQTAMRLYQNANNADKTEPRAASAQPLTRTVPRLW